MIAGRGVAPPRGRPRGGTVVAWATMLPLERPATSALRSIGVSRPYLPPCLLWTILDRAAGGPADACLRGALRQSRGRLGSVLPLVQLSSLLRGHRDARIRRRKRERRASRDDRSRVLPAARTGPVRRWAARVAASAGRFTAPFRPAKAGHFERPNLERAATWDSGSQTQILARPLRDSAPWSGSAHPGWAASPGSSIQRNGP
jgi:hypothetical protein